MIVTLYKNCILSNDYSEVFDVVPRTELGTSSSPKSVFDTYLETLQKTILTNYSNAYANEQGTLNISKDELMTLGFLDYNYISFEDNGLKRYCFIDEIDIRNNIILVKYSTDIWHTYAPKMNIRDSLLTKSLFTMYGSTNIGNRTIDIDYNSNTRPNVSSIHDITESVYVVCQYQVYKTDTQGKQSDRSCYVGLFRNSTSNTITLLGTTLYNALRQLQLNSGTTKIASGVHEDYFYEIDNVTLVPSAFNILNTYTKVSGDTLPYGSMDYLVNQQGTPTGGLRAISDLFILNNDYKTLGIGTMTNMYEVKPNGRSLQVLIESSLTPFDFKLFLSYQDKRIEITDDFVAQIPFDSITGDVTQQRKMARTLKTIGGSMNVVNGVVDIGIGATGGVIKHKTNYSRKYPDRITSSSTSVGRTEYKALSQGIDEVSGGIMGIIEANAPMYLSNKGTFAVSEGITNAYNGIVLYKTTGANNENEVNDFISNVGYTCKKIINNPFTKITSLSGLENTHNIMKFDFINLYGNFSQDVAMALKDILTNGIKVWYATNV